MSFRTLDEVDLRGERVFMRVDFNVPLDGETITSDTRIRKALPSIRAVLGQGASLVLASHLGRPKGRRDPSLSLAPVAARLSELLGQPVALAPDCVGPDAASMAAALKPREALLLENLRFHAEEQANDPGFARRLASLGTAYVNDAFGTAHRAHASTVGVARLMGKRAGGKLLETEQTYLSMATSSPRRPYVAIIGGAKITGKIDVIRNLLGLADKILIGGAMTYTFLKAQGIETGNSLVEAGKVSLARDLLDAAGDKIVLPPDHCVADRFSADADLRTVRGSVPPGWMGLDIGLETVNLYHHEIEKARMIVWNGPMGVFEFKPFAAGTLAIAWAVETASDHAVSIVGGGDSERAIRAARVGNKITHVSTGGGASLEFLSGKTLPGFAALA